MIPYISGVAECAKCGAEEFRDERCVAHFLMNERSADGRYYHVDLDLTGARLKEVTIRGVTFAGETHLDGCELKGEVRFEDCDFAGYLSMMNATAEGRLAFRDCRFKGIVNLNDTEFAELSIRRSEFDAPVELALGWRSAVDIDLTTFSSRSRLVGLPWNLYLHRASFPSGVQLRLDGAYVTLDDVEFGAPSSLTTLAGTAWPRLLAVSGTDVSLLSISDTDLSHCTFAGAHSLDGIGIESLSAFALAPSGPYMRRRVLWDECRWRALMGRAPHRWRDVVDTLPEKEPPSPGLIARDYRALRKAREDAKDEPSAADFRYGELEMRRMACRDDMRQAATWADWVTAGTEYLILWLYWFVSGYGLRAWRALTALVVVLAGASVIFRYAGFPDAGHTYAASVRFAIQSAMSLVRGTDEPLTPTGEWVALALRLLGPLLFGLALLALRGRVRR